MLYFKKIICVFRERSFNSVILANTSLHLFARIAFISFQKNHSK